MLALTVTGQQFLMLRKTKIKIPRNPLIFISADGFNYLNSKINSFLKISEIELSKGNVIRDWIEKNNIQDNPQLIITHNPGLFIPHAIFNRKYLKSYYKKFDKINDTDILATDKSANHINTIIYRLSNTVQNLKEEYLINSNTIHYQTVFYDYLVLKNKNNIEKKIYINIHEKSFDIFLFFGEQLQLVNRFPIQNSESYLYFLYFIIEKNGLKENEFSICFLGEYDIFCKYYDATKLFHNKIEFDKVNTQKNNNSNTPFLEDLHANYFRNS